jgi:CubicO group peptidase (beta-lactamase class C family)
MTFSASKGYISLCAARLRFRPAARPAGRCANWSTTAASRRRNAAVTAASPQLTSEWEGEDVNKPTSSTYNRDLASEGRTAKKGEARPLQAPGTHWEYNDVRVNRLALALLRLWKRGLPDLVRERIMNPIGASDGWEWHGYRNSWVEIDGRQVQSVSGGGHWGGGLFVDSYDHARVGLLMQRGGAWGGRQLVSSEWIRRSLTPATSSRPTATCGGSTPAAAYRNAPAPASPRSAPAATSSGRSRVRPRRRHPLDRQEAVDGLLGRTHALRRLT